MATATPSRPPAGLQAAADSRAGVREGLPPGSRAPAIVQTLVWAVAPTWLMDRCARRIGSTFTVTFAPSGIKLVMVSDPEAVRAVFTAPAEVAPSGAGASPVASVMGPSSVV